MEVKKFTNTITFIFLFTTSFGQFNVKDLVDSLKFLETDTLDCTADIYWKIIAQKEKAIPYLIDKLTDTTPTKIRYDCKKTPLNISEVSYLALTEIADFPIFDITGYQFDHIDRNGCSGFHLWYFFTDNLGHKPEFQKSVRKWWAKNKKKYMWHLAPRKYLTECRKKYGIKGHYSYN